MTRVENIRRVLEAARNRLISAEGNESPVVREIESLLCTMPLRKYGPDGTCCEECGHDGHDGRAHTEGCTLESDKGWAFRRGAMSMRRQVVGWICDNVDGPMRKGLMGDISDLPVPGYES